MLHLPENDKQPLIKIIINQGSEDNPFKEALRRALAKKENKKSAIDTDMIMKMLSSKLSEIEENTRTKPGQTNFIGGSA